MHAIYTESISEFRNNYDAALKKLAQGPVLLLQRSKPAAVLVEPESWNQIAEEMQELRNLVERLTEERWDKLLSQSQSLLADWATEALNEDTVGTTESIDSFFTNEEVNLP